MSKILMCCMNYRPEIISTGKYAFELCEYLAACGHEVEVVTASPHYPGWKTFPGYSPWRYATQRLDGVTVRRVPMYLNEKAAGFARLVMPFSWAMMAIPILLYRALWWRPDIVICVQPTIMMAPSALAVARLARAQAFQHVQDLEIDTALAVGHVRGGRLIRLVHAAEGWIMRRFDHNVTISDRMRDRMIAKGVRPERISVIRNWVDTGVVSPLGRPSAYRAELGIPPGAFVVQYSGQMGRKQALHVITRAAARLADDSRFVFVLAGNGPLRRDIERDVAGLGNVMLLPLQPTERLGEFLNLADCHILPQEAGVSELVLPSKLGGMLASGKRMLITADDDSELAQFLGDAAIFTPPGDVEAVVDALETMIDTPDTTAGTRKARARDLDSATLLPAFAQVLAAS
jgi:colanic acid biosynthesis glycosyl transferase WcaI